MRPTKANELKPCPHCGGKPYMNICKKLGGKSNDYHIQCSHCGSKTMTFNDLEWGEAKAEAEKRWNKRSEK
jgi:Lar family restriction alleviation protein